MLPILVPTSYARLYELLPSLEHISKVDDQIEFMLAHVKADLIREQTICASPRLFRRAIAQNQEDHSQQIDVMNISEFDINRFYSLVTVMLQL